MVAVEAHSLMRAISFPFSTPWYNSSMIRITGLYHLQQQTIRYGTGTKKTSSNKEGTVPGTKKPPAKKKERYRYGYGYRYLKNLQQQTRRYGNGTKQSPFLTSAVERIRIGIGSGFNWVSGSGSRQAKIVPQKRKKIIKFHV